MKKAFLGVAAVVLLQAAPVVGQTTVTVKGAHMCCPGCVKTIEKVLGKVDGVTAKVDRDAKSIAITANDAKAARKALRALRKAGFYGTTGNKKLSIKSQKTKKGKVERLTVAGAHNCCGACCKALKAVVAKVDGVTGENVKPRAKSFVVEGSFEPSALIQALNNAGFSVRIPKKKKQ